MLLLFFGITYCFFLSCSTDLLNNLFLGESLSACVCVSVFSVLLTKSILLKTENELLLSVVKFHFFKVHMLYISGTVQYTHTQRPHRERPKDEKEEENHKLIEKEAKMRIKSALNKGPQERFSRTHSNREKEKHLNK